MAGQATVTIRDKQWDVSVATAPWELAEGLGGLASIPAGSGMLFDLGYPQTIQVTTVPMLFPLDIAFLSDTLVVTEVYRNIQPGYLVTSTLPARYFLEVNAGELEGIDSGDRASVELLPSSGVMAVPDWTSAVVGFMGFMVMGVLMVSTVRNLVKGMPEEPKKRPELLPQTETRFKSGEILKYKGEKVRVLEHIGDRVSVWIPSRQEEVWVKPEKLERIESPASAQWEKRVVLSSLVFEELANAGLGYVAKEISTVVDKRSRENAWLELWDGTTFDRVGGYREHIGLTVPRLVVAEVGIRTGLSYDHCVAIGERIDRKLKEADTIVLDDGTTFRKAYVPVQRSSAVVPDKEKENLASRILRGLSGKEGEYRAYVKFPRDKSAFVTIGAIVGGHYSWNPAGFTVWVDSYERNPEWPCDSILGIKELRRPRSFEATEQGVKQALDYVEREFPSFTESKWVSKSIPVHVARELGLLSLELPAQTAPDFLLTTEEVMEYRVEENKPYGTWAIVELFPSGMVRSPFSTREEAIKREEEIGEYYGWKLKRVEFTHEEINLLDPQRFPKRTEALEKLRGYDVIHVHDDGDLTVRSRGKFYVVTTEGQTFEQKEYLARTVKGDPQGKPTGTCYEDAWRFLIKEEEGELVHGTVQTIGRRINHAWVETETGYIWEPESREFMKKDYFYKRAKPRVEARYTAEAAAIMAARTKHFGPWTEQERGQYLKGKSSVTQARVIPTEKQPHRTPSELEYFADSPEFLTQTLDAIGYRDRIDTAFQEAIRRARGGQFRTDE